MMRSPSKELSTLEKVDVYIMSWKSTLEPFLTRMPTVDRPEGHVPLNSKLLWTAGVLFVYLILTNIELVGMGTGGGSDFFGQFRSVLAGASGTILQVGIGPIVTASIVLQLLQGENLLGLDTDNDPRDQALYQGLQKVLVMIVTALTAIPFVFVGGLIAPDPELGARLGIGVFGVKMLLFAQIFIGGILILYLDEIISKWGVGSGVGMFIIAGVSQRLIGGFFSFPALGGTTGVLAQWYMYAFGSAQTPNPFTSEGLIQLLFGPGQIIPIVTTILIFGIVVVAESIRVEIPLQHANMKMSRGKWPVKLIYASVLPMILVRAVQMNIQLLGRVLSQQLGDAFPAFLGVYSSSGQPVSGLLYYLNPINQPQEWMWWLGTATAEPWMIMLRVVTDMTIMVVGGAVFAIFWVETTDMGPDAVARQIQNTPMQIPGFRNSQQVLESYLERYIPQVTVIGGALVGFLAVMANLMGTIGSVDGLGLLLSISIIYSLYEEIAQEQLMEAHPMIRQMFED